MTLQNKSEIQFGSNIVHYRLLYMYLDMISVQNKQIKNDN